MKQNPWDDFVEDRQMTFSYHVMTLTSCAVHSYHFLSPYFVFAASSLSVPLLYNSVPIPTLSPLPSLSLSSG